MTTPQPELGKGIYTARDISQILKLPKNKVNRWLNEYWKEYSWEIDKTKAINFNSLIEFYVFYQLRERGFNSEQIQTAHKQISKALNTMYPFASSQIITLDNKKIFFKDSNANVLNADETLHFLIKEIIEPFCEKIEYDSNKNALLFYPDGKTSSVVVDPRKQFGAPVIAGTGILAETLFLYNKGGESVAFIADIFDLTEQQVTDALNFFKPAA